MRKETRTYTILAWNDADIFSYLNSDSLSRHSFGREHKRVENAAGNHMLADFPTSAEVNNCSKLKSRRAQVPKANTPF